MANESIPNFLKVYTPGTDTRDLYTTPADPRQLADLIGSRTEALRLGHVRRATTWTHNSSGNWLTAPIDSGDILWGDETPYSFTNNNWVPPPAWFTHFTNLFFDVPVSCQFVAADGTMTTSGQVRLQVRALNSGGGSVRDQIIHQIPSPGGVNPITLSGTAHVRLQSGQRMDVQLFQSTGENLTVNFVEWGPRLVGAN